MRNMVRYNNDYRILRMRMSRKYYINIIRKRIICRMKNISEILQLLMAERNMSQAELSRLSGLPQPYIWRALKGNKKEPSLSTLAAIAKALKVPLETFIDGGVNLSEQKPVRGLRKVPLISWIQAGVPTPVSSLGDLDKWYLCPVSISENGFALKVHGESMEPMFYEGDIVFIDPDVAADPGRIVAAVDDGIADPEATLKKLVKDGPDYYLKALNPDWPGPKFQPFTETMRIAGVAVGKYVEL